MNAIAQFLITQRYQRYCDTCGRPFNPPASAPHKRFCSATCRDRWNYIYKTKPARLRASEKEPVSDLDSRVEGSSPLYR